MSTTATIREQDVLKTWVLQSTLNFTRYFFKENNSKKYLIGDHHLKICDALDKVIKGEITRLIINIAPRYGKTELAVKSFIAYGLALNPASKFIHLSYSKSLALDNSTQVQDTVKSEAFQELFDAHLVSESKEKWYTSHGGGMYSVSSGGQVTGFGAGSVDYQSEIDLAEIDNFIPYFHSEFAGAIVIDDPIKPDDALSDQKREAVNNKFETTIRNRVNSRKTPIIIIMQRLHPNDLCGYLEKLEGNAADGGEWTVLEFPCLTTDENGDLKALWEQKHNVAELQDMQLKNPFVFGTQYQQDPKPKEGLMYDRPFKEYEVVPYSPTSIRKNYTDTADTGSDYLCSINYVENEYGNYVTDIFFTQKPMEYTEPKTAEMITREAVQEVIVESNNGGRSFGRNVESTCRAMGNNSTTFNFVPQTGNKEVRIFTRANEVMNITYFPLGWERLYPEFSQQVLGYMKVGKNAHDDSVDCLTAMCEFREYGSGESPEGMFF